MCEDDDRRYHKLVLWHTVHHHTHACLDRNRHCKKNFPKPLVERTYIEDRGYVHYRRRSLVDQYVVTHNQHLLLLLESYFNLEVSCTVNLTMYLYKYMFKGPDRARYAHYDNKHNIIVYHRLGFISASACFLPGLLLAVKHMQLVINCHLHCSTVQT